MVKLTYNIFDGKTTRDKAIELIKRNTRRFAKRQITWWSKDEGIRWFGGDDKEQIIDYLTTSISGL